MFGQGRGRLAERDAGDLVREVNVIRETPRQILGGTIMREYDSRQRRNIFGFNYWHLGELLHRQVKVADPLLYYEILSVKDGDPFVYFVDSCGDGIPQVSAQEPKV
ncbi:hypothetical protein R1sor_000065 [Riccia sorocarpa]|uniref:Uncharacterized protein n=1 Tax=Riccia sorocarpa TaxID=122646 RepID=A0ABD3GSV9_9MARC